MKIIDTNVAKEIVSGYPDGMSDLVRGMNAKEICCAAATSLELHMEAYCRDVVCCGECRSWRDYGRNGEEWGVCNLIQKNRKSSDFCSRGERKWGRS